jgi:enamine deaminase RidA (YjgF/YER057c/UK114 family)
MTVTETLAQMGIALDAPPSPQGAYVPLVRTGDLIFVSGTLPLVNGAIPTTGTVGNDVSLEEGEAAARICMTNMFARLHTDLGGIDSITQWIKLTGFIASAPGFIQQPQVMNAASNLVQEVFGNAGRHSRSAVGVAALPLGAPVEIEAILRVR